MTWTEPIFDRTWVDVDWAKHTLEEWRELIAAGGTPTTSDLKGFLNPSDLNRIEGNTQYLADLLDVSGLTYKLNWSYSDCITVSAQSRIIGNVQELVTASGVSNTPEIPTTIMKYDNLNAIEQILFMIKAHIESLEVTT
jgi:hypothetical protein